MRCRHTGWSGHRPNNHSRSASEHWGANFNFTFSASTPMTLTHDRAHQMHTVLPHARPLCNLAGPPSRVLLAGVGGAAQAACITSSAVPNQTGPWGVTQLFPQDNDIWSSCPQVPASFNPRGAPVLRWGWSFSLLFGGFVALATLQIQHPGLEN